MVFLFDCLFLAEDKIAYARPQTAEGLEYWQFCRMPIILVCLSSDILLPGLLSMIDAHPANRFFSETALAPYLFSY